ncbi:hypothetical protein GXP70_20385 [Paenibacillus lycopersici]|uniref:Uncharacterized protein n=1 Tax=Paenibacillus lycopersici TaxID=2704462 RepID=A0A6C0G155_9BACL|nr:hypothetical protein [Paenibacillus lycopersici]QHT62102.1 hypothetical protein GXP70_20385 [Paenibacillus lycopersici]
MFTLFRFSLDKWLVRNVIVVALITSQVSYFTRLTPEIGNLTTYIQLFLFVVVLWVLFRVPLFYSIIMNFSGLISSFVTSGIAILLASFAGANSAEIQGNSMLTAAIQLLSALINIAVARLIYTRNWGFDFVPSERRFRVKINGTNAVLLAIIAVVVVLSVVITLIFRNDFDEYVITASLIFLLTIPVFFYFSLRKDNEDAT